MSRSIVRPMLDAGEARLLAGDRETLDQALALILDRAELRQPGHPRRRALLDLGRRVDAVARPGPVGQVTSTPSGTEIPEPDR